MEAWGGLGGLSRSTWDKFIAAIPAPGKFRMIFYHFCYYFWGHHCWWTETNTIDNNFFVKFPLSSTVLLLPLPYRTVGRKFSVGVFTFVQGGLDILKFYKNSTVFIVLHSSISGGGLELCLWGLGPQKAPSDDRIVSLPLLQRPGICMLCQRTSPKRWFANRTWRHIVTSQTAYIQ